MHSRSVEDVCEETAHQLGLASWLAEVLTKLPEKDTAPSRRFWDDCNAGYCHAGPLEEGHSLSGQNFDTADRAGLGLRVARRAFQCCCQTGMIRHWQHRSTLGSFRVT